MGHCGTPWEGVKVPGPGTPPDYALHCIAGGTEVDHVQSASKMCVRCWKQLNCEGYGSYKICTNNVKRQNGELKERVVSSVR